MSLPSGTRPQKFQAALWDLDGTLIDSEELHFHSWRSVMQSCGIDYSREEFLAGFGKTTATVFREYLGEDMEADRLAALTARKASLFRAEMVGTLELMPGADEWLEAFRVQGIRQVVASSAPMASIAAVLRELGLGDYFTALLSGAALPRSKPDPALFLQSAAAVGVSPAACVVLEDSRFGIEAARRAGMASVAVGTRAAAIQSTLEDELGHIPCVAVEDLSECGWRDVQPHLRGFKAAAE